MASAKSTKNVQITYGPDSVLWEPYPEINMHFLRGIEHHMQNLHRSRGHLFLNEVLDALGLQRTREGATSGWLDLPVLLAFENPDGNTITIKLVVEENIHENLG